MKPLTYVLMAIIGLSTLVCNAQLKNEQTETVKIYGNCGMCETTIEKAGNVKNEASVDWDKDTKMAKLSYDSAKTTKDAILKRIALAGYDSDTFFAPDDTYANLPGCCQYERNKQPEAAMDMSHTNENHDNHQMNEQDAKPLSSVFDSYFKLTDALVQTDGETASTKAKVLLAAINAVPMEKLAMDVHMAWMKVLEPLKEDAEHIMGTKDVNHQRDHFMTLSKNMYEVMKLSKVEKPVYYQFCPMANDGKGANWLSKEEAVKNPYYGSKMLSCGKTVETIEK